MSIEDKQYLAKILYCHQKLDAKIVAKKVGVSENTMSAWVVKFNWKSLRRRLLVSKEEILNNLYEQIEELNTAIKNKPPGQRFADVKQADALVKYTASIRNLETELAIADLVEAGIRFGKHLQQIAPEKMVEFMEYWNSFIQQSIKA